MLINERRGATMNPEIETFFPDAAVDISARRSEEFNQKSKELSDFIGALELDKGRNDQLIALMVLVIATGETDAFKYGLEIGLDIGKAYDYADKGEHEPISIH
jgi:hypothetical protein